MKRSTYWSYEHCRLGHLNLQDLQMLCSNQIVHELSIKLEPRMLECEICIQAKQMSTSFPKSSEIINTQVLELIHSDVVGHFAAVYFATSIDDYTRWTEVYVLKNKSDMKEAFMKFKARRKFTWLQNKKATHRQRA